MHINSRSSWIFSSSAVVVFASVVLGWTASPLSAQSAATLRSNPTGLMLAGHLNGSALSPEGEEKVESGGGLGLAVGYGFNRMVTLYLGVDGASMNADRPEDDYTLGQADLGVRVHLGGDSRAAVFFLDGALTGRVARYDVAGSNLDISGTGLSLGGGLEYFFSPGFALDVGLKFTFGSFDEISFEGETENIDISATGTRLNLGVSWYPAGK